MTFLCGPDLKAHVPRGEYAPGQWGWPKPWALRCDVCERILEYSGGHQTGEDRHECADCRNGHGQLTIFAGGRAVLA